MLAACRRMKAVASASSSCSGNRPRTRRYRSRTASRGLRQPSRGSPASRSDLAGQPPRLLVQERAVHQEEGLLRHGRDEPPRAGRVGHGEVEGAVDAVEVLTVDEPIERAPRRERRRFDRRRTGRRNRGPSEPETARTESRIDSKSSRWRLNRQSRRFSGSRGQLGWPRLALLLVRAREHDPPVQRLDRPAGLDELAGQVVEQLGMRRRVAAQPEVAGRADQSLAEMPAARPG